MIVPITPVDSAFADAARAPAARADELRTTSIIRPNCAGMISANGGLPEMISANGYRPEMISAITTQRRFVGRG